jgi:endoglucanase
LLRPVVDYCAENGFYVIVDWHYIDDTNQHRSTTTEFWSYMAPRFAEDSNVLFELFNEPINYGDWNGVRSDMQSWLDTVRASAPDNLVLVGTPNWCQNVGPTAANPVNGTNVAYVAHMYPMHWAEPSLRDEITTAAAAHPVFVSEWGFEQNSNEIVDGTISSYGNPFRQFIDGLGVSWTAWCASSSWFPRMFDNNYNLLVGEGYMGGFTKDWLYDMRNDGVPVSP